MGRRLPDGAGEGAAGRGGRLRAAAGRVPGGRAPLGPLPFPLAAAGQDAPLEEELTAGVRFAADRLVDHPRDSYGVFAAVREVQAAAGRAEALLAFLGRDPHRTPAVS